ncbi:MAG: YncE family protein [Eggerthellales bacterium]|nr:YncE family protein [Eggerthellales bacterium]
MRSSAKASQSEHAPLLMTRRSFSAAAVAVSLSAACALAGCGTKESEPLESPAGDRGEPSDLPAQSDPPTAAACFALEPGMVCVSEYAGNSIAVLDGLSGELLCRIEVGLNPMCLAQSKSHVAMTVSGNGEVCLFPRDDAYSYRGVACGTQPLGICYSEAASRYFVTDYFGSSVNMLDETVGSVVGSCRLNEMGFQNRREPPDCCKRDAGSSGGGRMPVVVEPSPDGSVLYCANYGTYDIAVIDSSAMEDTGAFDGVVGPRAMCVSRDGSKAFLVGVGGESTERETDLRVVDLATGKLAARVSIGAGIAGVCVSEDETVAYCASRDEAIVALVDLSTFEVVGSTILEEGIEAVGLSDDGSLLYVCNNQTGRVCALDASTLDQVWVSDPLMAPKDLLVLR